MAEHDYEILNSQTLITRGFDTDPVFIGQEADRLDLEKMRNKAVIDAVAQQIMGRKSQLAAVVGQELVRQAANLFLEELEAHDKLLTRAEKLHSHHARKRYIKFLESLWDQFDRFLLYNALEGARSVSTVARKSPFPEPEEQRSWLRKLFGG